MGKQTKVLHGSCSEVFINGQREPLATKIEVKVTGDFEDATFCGDYGTFPIYNGYSVEGKRQTVPWKWPLRRGTAPASCPILS